ncbi:MAG: hypothetical protein WA156_09885 [Methylocystis silviterrae]|jgi:hypothetical protein
MRKKLSPESIDALPPATGKRYEARDELVPGLLTRIMQRFDGYAALGGSIA